MRILYLSCHSILEYDEVKLLTELGHEVFSPGAYVEPRNPGDASLRPSLDIDYKNELLKELHNIGQMFPGEDSKDHLTRALMEHFDCVVTMHIPRWIQKNWQVFLGKRVIWRTIGQSITNTEQSLLSYRKKGLQIVRYSPMEASIPGYIGEDAMIRFYKDPDEYQGWTGEKKQVITFAQHMKQRHLACNYRIFEQTTRPFPRHLFGPGNEGESWSSGKQTFEQLQDELRQNRVYFYTGTHPASYTLNFIEAWMTGIPVVAIGEQYGNASYFPNHHLYEVHKMIDNGENGFVSNNPVELQQAIKTLFTDDAVATEISKRGREAAIELFGKEKIKQQWKEFLG